ncbi:MAG: protein kinase [Firmicutes bacterium]|nr:protein kinase [Bacillota bacterium]
MAKTEIMHQQKTAKLGENANENFAPILLAPIEFEENGEIYQISTNLINFGGESQIYHATSSNGAECVAKIGTSVLTSTNKINRQLVVKFLKEHGEYRKFHIMPLLASGEINLRDSDDRELPYPVDIFPYCPNGDLKRLTQNGKKFSYAELKNTVIPALCKALHAIHENNIIHRDIKPDNIYELNGEIVVGDFGTAVFTASDEDDTVRTELARRTIGYTAHEVTARYAKKASDYFSLGCTLATLYNGKHPYSATLANETEYIFYESMTTKGMLMDYRKGDEPLKSLIDALVRMNWTDRPTHNDIMLWLADERAFYAKFASNKIPITAKKDWQTPFKFSQTLECWSKSELATAIIADWEQGKRYLYRGQLRNFLQAEPFLQDKIDRITEESPTAQNQDFGLSQFLHYLLDGGNLVWKGRQYRDLAEISADMWQNHKSQTSSNSSVSSEITEMLESGYLSWKMNETSQLPHLSADRKSAIKTNLHLIEEIEQLYKEYPNFAYYYAMFTWSNEPLVGTANDLFKSHFTNSPNFFQSAKQLKDNIYLWAAIAAMGFLEQVKALQGKLDSNKDFRQSINDIYFLFESVCGDKKAVRSHYLKYSPKSYLYWLQQNLQLYAFESQYVKKLKADIEKIKLSENMSLAELESSFTQLNGHFANYPNLLELLRETGTYSEIVETPKETAKISDYVEQEEICDDCLGSGINISGTLMTGRKCAKCNGTGKIMVESVKSKNRIILDDNPFGDTAGFISSFFGGLKI